MSKTKTKPGVHLYWERSSVYDKVFETKPKWYWHIVARNGRIIARSSETYTRKSGAVKSIRTAANLFYAQISTTGRPAYYDHSKPDSPLQSYL